MGALLSELFALEADFAGACDTDKQKAGLELILNHPDRGVLLLLKRDVKVVGMVNLAFGFSTFEGGPVIMLEDFIVSAAERGRGSGRFLWNGLSSMRRRTVFCGLRCSLTPVMHGRCIFTRLRATGTPR